MNVKNAPLIEQLPRVETIRLPALLSMGIIILALLAFLLHGVLVLGYGFEEPYVVTTLLRVIAGVAGFCLVFVGRTAQGLRLLVVTVFLTIMVEPYIVSSHTLAYSLMLLPPGLIALVLISGVVFRLRFSLALAVLASANTALVFALSAERVGPLGRWIYELIPVASALVLVSALIVYLWVGITRTLLNRASTLVRERELLIQETNHRVKNNLQMITSVLDLQRREAKHQEVGRALSVAGSRIRAVAAVHQALHVTGKEGDGELLPFLQRLLEAVEESLGETDVPIRLEAEESPVRVRGSAMVPLALVLNELVTNSVQHGLVGVQNGCVTISVESVGGGYSITVEDNGAGLPAGFDPKHQSSLGFTLIQALVEEQLEGSIQIHSDEGAAVTIILPNKLFLLPKQPNE